MTWVLRAGGALAVVVALAFAVLPASEARRSSRQAPRCLEHSYEALAGDRGRALLPDGQRRARRILAPGPVQQIRICRYLPSYLYIDPFHRRDVLVTRARVLRQLTRRLNALPPALPFSPCTREGPSEVLIVLLSYRRGGPVGIRVQPGNCRQAVNRHVARRISPLPGGRGQVLTRQLRGLLRFQRR